MFPRRRLPNMIVEHGHIQTRASQRLRHPKHGPAQGGRRRRQHIESDVLRALQASSNSRPLRDG
jgi:hypothetical protein